MRLDWGGGYYLPGVTQYEIILRLIMFSGGGDSSVVLPSGRIYGWKHTDETNGSSPKVLDNANVGRDGCSQEPKSY